MFLRNLLLNEKYVLKNRTLHIRAAFKQMKKPDIKTLKPDIEAVKSDIDTIKPDIEQTFHPKTAAHIFRLREAFPGQTIFGRSDVMEVIDIGLPEYLIFCRRW